MRRSALMPLRKVTGIAVDETKLVLDGSRNALLMVTPFNLTPTFGVFDPVEVKRN